MLTREIKQCCLTKHNKITNTYNNNNNDNNNKGKKNTDQIKEAFQLIQLRG